MHIDTTREQRLGWGALAASVLVGLLAVWLVHDQGELAGQVEEARRKRAAGSQSMEGRVADQARANAQLSGTIEALKKEVGFHLEQRFSVPPEDKQPGFFFVQRFLEVKQDLREKARRKGIAKYDENLGFGADPKVPDDSQAAFLLHMLQLTEKATRLALATPTPLQRIMVTHGVDSSAAVETGSELRPPLLREYPLVLDVRGSLKDILWILHRLSHIDPAANGLDYPVIVRKLTIESANAKPIDDIQQLDAVFHLAGMQFLNEQERAERAARLGLRMMPVAPAAAPGATPVAAEPQRQVHVARP